MARRTSKKDEKKVTLDELYTPTNMEDYISSITAPIITHERNYEDIEGFPQPGECRVARMIDLEGLYPSLNRKITGFCVMCEQILTKDFPEDYPVGWKFCCFCKMVAEHLITTQHTPINSTPHFKKILDKITLVGE